MSAKICKYGCRCSGFPLDHLCLWM
uniref:Uncharacterized protein n=1 Tax=Zea mays TaxID=4577 RepID=C4J262_MAIZE|nr:unknown [Zea mays]